MDTEPQPLPIPLHREQGRHVLIAGYIAIWLLMTLLLVAALAYMSAIQTQLREVVDIHNTKKELVKQMHASTRERVFSLQHMLLLEDPFLRDAESLKIYQYGVEFTQARGQFMALPLDATEQTLMEQHALLASRAGPTQSTAVTLIMSDEFERARRLLLSDVIPIQKEALALLKDLEEYQEASIKAALQHGEASYRSATTLLIILGGFAALLLLAIAIKVIRVMRLSSQALLDEKERMRVTLHSIGDGVIATDSRGTIEYLNPVAAQLTGWSSQAAGGAPILEVFNVIGAADGQPVASSFGDLVAQSPVSDLHHHSLLQRPDGTTLAIDYTATAIHHHDGSISGYVTVFRDESALREMAHHLSHQATHDPLTNLVNRREFERRVESLLRNNDPQQGEHVLCYIDLDRFKIVNDTCGHAAGDELLKQTVALFRQRARSNDLLARIGGDEFGLLLENCPVERAMAIAEEMRSAVHRYRFIWQGKSFQIGTSIGMVAVDTRWASLPELLAAADAACYAAKEGGRNRVHLYIAGDAGPSAAEATWPTRLQYALEQERFIHYYQKPVALQPAMPETQLVDLQLRIIEQGRQRLPFAPLLPQAERHGLAPRIDRWAVEHALILALLREERAAIYSVPLSATSLQDENLAAEIAAMAQQRAVSPSQLCLEFPESFLLSNAPQASAAALALKQQGFHIALEGSGHSIGTLDTLRSIPFDYLRISTEVVHAALEDQILHIQLEAIVRMAHSMGMCIIAMDLQSSQVIEQARELGIDYISGHGIDKPQPAIALLITDLPEELAEASRDTAVRAAVK